MLKKILPICLLSFGLNSYSQEKQTDIEEIRLHDKFLHLSYETANENITVITKKDLENSPAQIIDEVLQQYVGMDIRKEARMEYKVI